MKQKYKTDAINLKSYDFGEADKIVMMYSKDKGLIKCMAKGSKKQNGKLGGRMDMFVANKLLLTKGKSMDSVSQAEVLNSFLKLRENTDKMFYSMYCVETVKNFGEENDDESEAVYNLIYSVLSVISECKNEVEIMLAVMRFQLKIMEIFGYAPDFTNCVICSKEIGDNYSYFSFEHGGLVCESHNIIKSGRIHPKIKNFFKVLSETDFKTKTDYDKLADIKVCKPCFELLRKYIEYHSPKKFNSVKIMSLGG